MFSAIVGKCSAIDAVRRVGRGVLLACAAVLLTVAVPAHQALAEAIRLEISNFPTWKELEGVRGVPRSNLRLSTLERWNAQSQPYVRITNETNSPMVGFNLDLKNWDAKIDAAKQLYGPEQSSWKWQEDLQTATFQLKDPLLPGKAMVMRLTTAPKAGLENKYRMNQTLFSAASVSCMVSPAGGGIFNMFLDQGGQPFIFSDAGGPIGTGIQTATIDLQNFPIKPIDTIAPSGTSENIPITPVPEPGTLLLAVSAAAMIAVRAMRR
jgi:hypothetical protein